MVNLSCYNPYEQSCLGQGPVNTLGPSHRVWGWKVSGDSSALALPLLGHTNPPSVLKVHVNVVPEPHNQLVSKSPNPLCHLWYASMHPPLCDRNSDNSY